LTLTPPLLKNNELFILGKNDSIAFKHPMPGVIIRYTTNGKNPDSNHSNVFSKAFSIENTVNIKAIAVRPGWYASPVTDFTFFLRGYKPSNARILKAPDKNYPAEGMQTLLDGKKGEPSNLKSFWLGFRETPFEGLFNFSQPVSVHEIVLSTARNLSAFVLPPEKIEVWAGKDTLHMSIIATLKPLQPAKYEPDKIEAQILPINGSYGCFKVIVYPVKKIPRWHTSKGEKAWIFLDEIFFN
jgi:Fn3 associated